MARSEGSIPFTRSTPRLVFPDRGCTQWLERVTTIYHHPLHAESTEARVPGHEAAPNGSERGFDSLHPLHAEARVPGPRLHPMVGAGI